MFQYVEKLLSGYEPWQLAIELAVIWICVYVVFRFLQGTRGAGVVKGFALVLVLATVTIWVLARASDAFTRLNYIYERFLGLAAILLIVVFQPELRQAMSRLGHAWTFRASGSSVNSVVEAVSTAVAFLSKSQFGALIAIERSSRLGGLIETGVPLDARVSARLLESIFWPNSPLHDLGVIIRGERILAASVQFPLAEEGIVPVEYGSRHRAAVGLSIETDCIVVIVSEETGGIAIAERGQIEGGIDRESFSEVLSRRLRAPVPVEAPPAEAGAIAESEDLDPDEKQAA